MESDDKFFARDDKFWDNYLKGRPHAPDALFDRIFGYHEAKGGNFGTCHDVGAGNGIYSRRLRSRFAHVIVSDIVAENVKLARERLVGGNGGGGDGDDEEDNDDDSGFRFRVAELQDVGDIAAGSVDLVFAANVLHFPADQHAAMGAVARQLRPGGTFAAAVFGPARFHNPRLQDLWARVSHQGGRELLRTAADREQTMRVMARTQDRYNAAPLDRALFAPGAQRVHLNMGRGGVQGILPPEVAHRISEPDYTGTDDVEIYEDEEGWGFETDLAGVKEHFGSFPFVSQFPGAFKELYQELDDLAGEGPFKGYFPAKVILATRL